MRPLRPLLCAVLVCLIDALHGATIVIEDDGQLILEDDVTLVIDDTADANIVVSQPRRVLQVAPEPTCTLERADTRCMRSEGYHGYWPPSPSLVDADVHESPEACAKHMFAALREARIKAPIPILYRNVGSDTACLSCWHQPMQLDNYMWKTTTFVSEPGTHVYRCSFADA